MLSCLGLYIENNIIKYAKLSKERDNIRIDAFGMKFYDDIDEALKQIVGETFSYRVPISVNLSDEKYTYSDLFSLLNKKDLEKAVDTEFEYFCSENGKNKNALEYRHLLIPKFGDRDKITSLYAYTDKTNIIGKLQMLDGYKISNIIPLPISIANLSQFKDKSNSVIVNIEKNTSVTTIVNGKVYKVDIIEKGMQEIFDSISIKENSYSKAYEICKNSTIYTMQGKNLQVEENEYMEDIMPVLYNIVEQVRDIIAANDIDIGKIYITGLAAAINNIDLYFEENFIDKQCEILSPFFIQKANIKLNIKDYIEVNSAISLALQGIEIGEKNINFKKQKILDKLTKNSDIKLGSKNNKTKEKTKKEKTNAKKISVTDLFKGGIGTPLDFVERMMLRSAGAILVLIIIYTMFSKIITKQINNKEKQIDDYILDTNNKIGSVEKNIGLVNSRTSYYEEIMDKIDRANDELTQSYARRNKVPNLLNEIGNIIPKGVQLLSIKNPTSKSVKIEAQALDYDQLGYFISKIKVDAILTNVKTTQKEKQGNYVQITIEGDLIY